MSSEKTIKFFNRRLFLVLSVKVFLFVTLISRLFYLQIIKNKYFLEKSQNNSLKKIFLSSKRGDIFDQNGKILAESFQVYVVLINLSNIKNINGFLEKYQHILSLDEKELAYIEKNFENFHENKAKSKKIIEIKNISFESLLELKYNNQNLDEIHFIKKKIRIYPSAEITAHIVGYIKNDIKKNKIINFDEYVDFQSGVSGIEKKFDQSLVGKDKVLQIKIDAFGKKIDEEIVQDGADGENVFSSIDSNLQAVILNFFKDRKKIGSACVCELDDKSGLAKIISCVSAPSFDPNFLNDSSFSSNNSWSSLFMDETKPLINRAISGIYPPGSIFKILIALAALEQKIITKNTTIFCNGGYMVGNRKYSCLGHHGPMDVSDAIKFSCNTFFYALAAKMDVDELYNLARSVGLGEISNLNLNGEKSALMPNPAWKKKRFGDSWRIGDTANLMIGQGYVALTPLQFNRMVSSIAFGFKANFSLLAKNDASITDKKEVFASEENLKIIRHAMFRGINEPGGTSFRAIGLVHKNLNICGKTGTVQTFSKKDAGFNHSVFVGFMPFEKPKYTVSIVGEDCGYGSQFAAPLAASIFAFLEKKDLKS